MAFVTVDGKVQCDIVFRFMNTQGSTVAEGSKATYRSLDKSHRNITQSHLSVLKFVSSLDDR